MVLPHLVKALEGEASVSAANLIRLLTSLLLTERQNYEQLSDLIEDQVLRNLEIFQTDAAVFAELLVLLSSCNGQRGLGSAEFWKKASAAVAGAAITPEADIVSYRKLLVALVKARVLDLSSGGAMLEAFFSHIDKAENQIETLSDACFVLLGLAATEEGGSKKEKLEAWAKIVFRRLSFESRYFPLKQWKNIKYFAFFCRVTFPHWDQQYIEVLGYHSEKRYFTKKMRSKALTKSIESIAQIVQTTTSDLSILSLVDFHNLFLLDFAVSERKLAIRLKTKEQTHSTSTKDKKKMSVYYDIENLLLRIDNWVIFEIDMENFAQMGAKKASWLIEQVKAAHSLASTNSEEYVRELKMRIPKRMVKISELLYNDPKNRESATKRPKLLKYLEEQKLDLDAVAEPKQAVEGKEEAEKRMVQEMDEATKNRLKRKKRI